MKESGSVERYGDIQMTDNNFRQYEIALRIPRDFWKNKVILDLGSGKGANFEVSLKKKVPETKVVSMSPNYFLNPDDAKMDKEGRLVEANTLAGDARKLPFKDESFDLIVSFTAVPFYLKSIDEYEEVLKEIKRVLKNGGEARLFPAFCRMEGDKRIPYSEEEVVVLLDHLSLKHETFRFFEGAQETLVIRKE